LLPVLVLGVLVYDLELLLQGDTGTPHVTHLLRNRVDWIERLALQDVAMLLAGSDKRRRAVGKLEDAGLRVSTRRLLHAVLGRSLRDAER
jgi:hypothetical protein